MYNTFYKLPTFLSMGIKETPHHFCDQEDEELERGTCGDDRRSSCAKTDIKSRTPPILATDSACWYSSMSATASLYTACSSQTKTSPSIKKGKTLIDTIIWNIRRNVSSRSKVTHQTLLPTKEEKKTIKEMSELEHIPHLPNTATSL